MSLRSLLVIVLICPPVFSTEITLDLNSLPSSQGWTFSSPSGLTESSVFSLGDDLLQQNTLGDSSNIAYYSLQRPGLFDPALPFDVIVSAIVLQEQRFPPPDESNGFEFGVIFDNVQAALGLGLDRVSYSSPTNIVNVASNNSSFAQTFDMHWDGNGNFSYFIDGTLIGSAAASQLSGSAVIPTIFFGDGVSFANAEVDVTALTFSQVSVPEPTPASSFAIAMLVILCTRLTRPSGAGQIS